VEGHAAALIHNCEVCIGLEEQLDHLFGVGVGGEGGRQDGDAAVSKRRGRGVGRRQASKGTLCRSWLAAQCSAASPSLSCAFTLAPYSSRSCAASCVGMRREKKGGLYQANSGC
jgi:hypothetical protein